MKHITYIIYCVCMYGLTFLPFFYVIFWRNANPWWFLLAAFMANMVSSPTTWNLLDQPKQDIQPKEEKLIISEDESK